MYVIVITNFAFSYRKPFFNSNQADQFIKPVTNFGRQYFSTIFNAPYYMIIDVVYAGPSMCVFIHTYSIT